MIEAADFTGKLLDPLPGRPPADIWVHVAQPSEQELEQLQASFPMNKLALEDALEEGHPSHYSSYPEGDVLTFRFLCSPEELGEESQRLTLFLYSDRLLSLSSDEPAYLAEVRATLEHDPASSAGDIAFRLLDQGARSYAEFVHNLEDRIDELELGMFGEQQDQHQKRLVPTVFGLKQRLTQARRLCLEAQDALVLLARHASASEEDLLRFRDVRDSMNRLCKRLDTSRDNLTNLLSIYSSVQSQRMNEVMRTLAAVSTVFLPLTFLAGVWGMNFEHMPELHWPFGYALAWLSFVLVAAALTWVFRRRGWW
ncbi:Mg2 transporter protein CorA family protein [Deinococcus proteolyticus MRP]|uniref:Mg2 transporter protein CorA family protein n=1 Tax=Deinococcus proteolyticus (strain ATCC 35074 / DSM 20540 / JCM 6276 / NBRC 101906 / NCIMB 13154 / VKM Ac-1939 / CCM 2703 / MRP) TaxID=693977 RepID=F0RMQ3_DEIPM|nr:magnesium transporter CorA family protein [Deinococcus proteolyticus]ADY27121.1 Mg2 transporter protein CorA family protein [Deinococcus proteolyticus MRP]